MLREILEEVKSSTNIAEDIKSDFREILSAIEKIVGAKFYLVVGDIAKKPKRYRGWEKALKNAIEKLDKQGFLKILKSEEMGWEIEFNGSKYALGVPESYKDELHITDLDIFNK